jgi:hypothetical protein
VKCKSHNNNAENGGKCNWVGQLAELESHHLTNCFVDCASCKLPVLRKDFKHHVDVVCKKICEYCGLNVICKLINDHMDLDCPEKLINCSNVDCYIVNIARKDLQNHKLNDCLFQPLKCPLFTTYCGSDCDGFVLRKNFETHIFDNTINTHSAIISSRKKTAALENKILVLSTKTQNCVFVLKLLELAEELTAREEVLLKKWIEIYNNDNLSNNKQSIENLFKDIVFKKKRKLNNEENLKITNTIIYEFKIPKKFTKNDAFNAFSRVKVLHEEIKGYLRFKYFKNSETFGIYLYLENFKKEASWRFTFLNFNGTKNVSYFFTKNWKEIECDSGRGIKNFIKFDDFINENFLFEEIYVARIIAKIDLKIV